MDKYIIQFRNGYYSVCFSKPLKIDLYKAIVLILFWVKEKYSL